MNIVPETFRLTALSPLLVFGDGCACSAKDEAELEMWRIEGEGS